MLRRSAGAKSLEKPGANTTHRENARNNGRRKARRREEPAGLRDQHAQYEELSRNDPEVERHRRERQRANEVTRQERGALWSGGRGWVSR